MLEVKSFYKGILGSYFGYFEHDRFAGHKFVLGIPAKEYLLYVILLVRLWWKRSPACGAESKDLSDFRFFDFIRLRLVSLRMTVKYYGRRRELHLMI